MQQIIHDAPPRSWKGWAGVCIPLALAMTAAAGPVSTSRYSISVFAQGTSSYSHPDSVTVAGNSVFVTYANGVAPD